MFLGNNTNLRMGAISGNLSLIVTGRAIYETPSYFFSVHRYAVPLVGGAESYNISKNVC